MKDFKLTFEIAFALKNVHTPLRSDGDGTYLSNWMKSVLCSHSTQVRWGHPPRLLRQNLSHEVHTPLRSDGDLFVLLRWWSTEPSSHSTQVRWGPRMVLCPFLRIVEFTLHSGQMGTNWKLPFLEITMPFTLHSGQMGTASLNYNLVILNLFTLHSGQMGTDTSGGKTTWLLDVHTPLRSDGDPACLMVIRCSRPGSHSTQVRWGHETLHVLETFEFQFTLHSGQMGTISSSLSHFGSMSVHTPLRSDGNRLLT